MVLFYQEALVALRAPSQLMPNLATAGNVDFHPLELPQKKKGRPTKAALKFTKKFCRDSCGVLPFLLQSKFRAPQDSQVLAK